LPDNARLPRQSSAPPRHNQHCCALRLGERGPITGAVPSSLKQSAEPLRNLSRASGLDLLAYREEHVTQRVSRALEREGVEDVDELARLLACDDGARRHFRRSVAMVVTGLFRDPEQFQLLERELLPLVAGTRRQLRIWSAGCADGSELYSVGIVLAEMGLLDRATLLGSDLLEENLALAEGGVYGDVQLPASLRAHIRWEQRDLLHDSTPQGKWSVVICRNVAIYLRPEAKRRLHERLAGALAPGGVLLLGRSEQIAAPAHLGLERVAPHAYRSVA
jgi:chemotaxis protein methyltransferase CheR